MAENQHKATNQNIQSDREKAVLGSQSHDYFQETNAKLLQQQTLELPINEQQQSHFQENVETQGQNTGTLIKLDDSQQQIQNDSAQNNIQLHQNQSMIDRLNNSSNDFDISPRGACAGSSGTFNKKLNQNSGIGLGSGQTIQAPADKQQQLYEYQDSDKGSSMLNFETFNQQIERMSRFQSHQFWLMHYQRYAWYLHYLKFIYSHLHPESRSQGPSSSQQPKLTDEQQHFSQTQQNGEHDCFQTTASGIKVTRVLYPSLSPIGKQKKQLSPLKAPLSVPGDVTPDPNDRTKSKNQDTDKQKHSQSDLVDRNNDDISASVKDHKSKSAYGQNRFSNDLVMNTKGADGQYLNYQTYDLNKFEHSMPHFFQQEAPEQQIKPIAPETNLTSLTQIAGNKPNNIKHYAFNNSTNSFANISSFIGNQDHSASNTLQLIGNMRSPQNIYQLELGNQNQSRMVGLNQDLSGKNQFSQNNVSDPSVTQIQPLSPTFKQNKQASKEVDFPENQEQKEVANFVQIENMQRRMKAEIFQMSHQIADLRAKIMQIYQRNLLQAQKNMGMEFKQHAHSKEKQSVRLSPKKQNKEQRDQKLKLGRSYIFKSSGQGSFDAVAQGSNLKKNKEDLTLYAKKIQHKKLSGMDLARLQFITQVAHFRNQAAEVNMEDDLSPRYFQNPTNLHSAPRGNEVKIQDYAQKSKHHHLDDSQNTNDIDSSHKPFIGPISSSNLSPTVTNQQQRLKNDEMSVRTTNNDYRRLNQNLKQSNLVQGGEIAVILNRSPGTQGTSPTKTLDTQYPQTQLVSPQFKHISSNRQVRKDETIPISSNQLLMGEEPNCTIAAQGQDHSATQITVCDRGGRITGTHVNRNDTIQSQTFPDKCLITDNSQVVVSHNQLQNVRQRGQLKFNKNQKNQNDQHRVIQEQVIDTNSLDETSQVLQDRIEADQIEKQNCSMPLSPLLKDPTPPSKDQHPNHPQPNQWTVSQQTSANNLQGPSGNLPPSTSGNEVRDMIEKNENAQDETTHSAILSKGGSILDKKGTNVSKEPSGSVSITTRRRRVLNNTETAPKNQGFASPCPIQILQDNTQKVSRNDAIAEHITQKNDSSFQQNNLQIEQMTPVTHHSYISNQGTDYLQAASAPQKIDQVPQNDLNLTSNDQNFSQNKEMGRRTRQIEQKSWILPLTSTGGQSRRNHFLGGGSGAAETFTHQQLPQTQGASTINNEIASFHEFSGETPVHFQQASRMGRTQRDHSSTAFYNYVQAPRDVHIHTVKQQMNIPHRNYAGSLQGARIHTCGLAGYLDKLTESKVLQEQLKNEQLGNSRVRHQKFINKVVQSFYIEQKRSITNSPGRSMNLQQLQKNDLEGFLIKSDSSCSGCENEDYLERNLSQKDTFNLRNSYQSRISPQRQAIVKNSIILNHKPTRCTSTMTTGLQIQSIFNQQSIPIKSILNTKLNLSQMHKGHMLQKKPKQKQNNEQMNTEYFKNQNINANNFGRIQHHRMHQPSTINNLDIQSIQGQSLIKGNSLQDQGTSYLKQMVSESELQRALVDDSEKNLEQIALKQNMNRNITPVEQLVNSRSPENPSQLEVPDHECHKLQDRHDSFGAIQELQNSSQYSKQLVLKDNLATSMMISTNNAKLAGSENVDNINGSALAAHALQGYQINANIINKERNGSRLSTSAAILMETSQFITHTKTKSNMHPYNRMPMPNSKILRSVIRKRRLDQDGQNVTKVKFNMDIHDSNSSNMASKMQKNQPDCPTVIGSRNLSIMDPQKTPLVNNQINAQDIVDISVGAQVADTQRTVEDEKVQMDYGSRSMSIQKLNNLKDSKQSVKSGESVQYSNLKGAQYSKFGKLSSQFPSNHDEDTFGARVMAPIAGGTDMQNNDSSSPTNGKSPQTKQSQIKVADNSPEKGQEPNQIERDNSIQNVAKTDKEEVQSDQLKHIKIQQINSIDESSLEIQEAVDQDQVSPAYVKPPASANATSILQESPLLNEDSGQYSQKDQESKKSAERRTTPKEFGVERPGPEPSVHMNHNPLNVNNKSHTSQVRCRLVPQLADKKAKVYEGFQVVGNSAQLSPMHNLKQFTNHWQPQQAQKTPMTVQMVGKGSPAPETPIKKDMGFKHLKLQTLNEYLAQTLPNQYNQTNTKAVFSAKQSPKLSFPKNPNAMRIHTAHEHGSSPAHFLEPLPLLPNSEENIDANSYGAASLLIQSIYPTHLKQFQNLRKSSQNKILVDHSVNQPERSLNLQQNDQQQMYHLNFPQINNSLSPVDQASERRGGAIHEIKSALSTLNKKSGIASVAHPLSRRQLKMYQNQEMLAPRTHQIRNQKASSKMPQNHDILTELRAFEHQIFQQSVLDQCSSLTSDRHAPESPPPIFNTLNIPSFPLQNQSIPSFNVFPFIGLPKQECPSGDSRQRRNASMQWKQKVPPLTKRNLLKKQLIGLQNSQTPSISPPRTNLNAQKFFVEKRAQMGLFGGKKVQGGCM